MDIVGYCTALGLATAAGLNAWIPLLATGLLARYTDVIHLDGTWANLENTAVLIALALGVTEARAQDRIHDDWATPGLGAVVRLAPCANASQLCGRLVWVWDPEDAGGGAVGTVILRDFVYARGAWREGTVSNPEDGRTYRGEITPDGHNVLRLRGCAGPFCQTQVWRRLSSIPRP